MSRFALTLLGLLVVPLMGAEKPNVLLICIDDLRPELACYGEDHMVTPHLDKLAATGRLFNRHYVQFPTCGASRYSMMTGHYPRTGAAWGNGAFGTLKPDDKIVTMPEAFRAAGYTTISLGKISHQPGGHVFSYEGKGDGRVEMPDAWDEVTGPIGKWRTAWNAFFGYADGSSRTERRQEKTTWPFAEAADVDDHGYPDGLIADMAIDRLGKMEKGKPFFLAVGFFKPHLPFNAPKKYWDLYDPAKITLAPRGGKPMSPKPTGGEFLGYTKPDGVDGVEARERHARHAYFAAVSYIDAQVGKVLAALESSGHADNTVVVVWGDHGWHLGDHDRWGKHTLYERSLRSAFIVRTPNMRQPGKATDALVGSVDLYPTLVELCGVDGPDDLDGESFTSVLTDPGAPGKQFVRGFWRGNHTYRFDTMRITVSPRNDPYKLLAVYNHADDPLELNDIKEKHPDAAKRIQRLSVPSP